MRQGFTTIVALLCCLTAMAQWTKPTTPAKQPLEVGKQVYLYNVDADAFWLGANDWGTRASVSPTHGFKVTIEQYVLNEGDAWDGVSYKLMSLVEKPGEWQDGLTMAAKLANWNSIWVDAEEGNADDKGWTFNKQGDGSYIIGLSPLNQNFNPKEGLENACLGIIPEQNDTRVYLCTEDGGYDYARCKTHWAFVTEADYTAYIAAVKQYDAAVLLGNDIDKAKEGFASVDISSVEAVYNNHASTPEQLAAARVELAKLLMAAASPKSPLDVTWLYLTNPAYDNNDNKGWSGTTPGFDIYGNAEFYWKNYDYKQTLTVPQGVYRASVDAFYRAGWADWDAEAAQEMQDGNHESAKKHARLYTNSTGFTGYSVGLPFASEGATEEALHGETLQNSFGYIPNRLSSAAAYIEAGRYTATAIVGMAGNDGALCIGLKKDVQIDGDWTVFDNWKVEYVGNDAEAYGYLASDFLAHTTDYLEQIASEEITVYGHAAYDEYKAAREALDAATTAEQMAAAMVQVSKAQAAMDASVEAYNKYVAKYLEAEAFIEQYGESMMGDGMDLLSDYMQNEDGPSADFPNGGAQYIMNEGTLTAEAVLAEIAFIQKLMDDAMASGMQDGQDCTELIKNPHFNEQGVWTKEGLPEWPVGPEHYRLAQGWSILFDVNQTLTGLQNGLYELTLNDFFRPADFGKEDYSKDYRAYVYMNSDEAKLNHIESSATEEAAYDGDAMVEEGKYVPNSLDGAAKAFGDGRYKQTLFGLVTDGTLKLGVRNDLRYEGCWAVWSDFKLTFRAKNPEVLASVLAASIPNAQAKLANKCGNEELDALADAIDAAKGEPEDGYEALVDLKKAMVAVDLSTENYMLLQTAIATAEETLAANAGKTSAELTALKKATDEAAAGYEAGSFNAQAAADKAAEVNAAVVAVKMGGGSAEEKDVTDLIVNNTFDPSRGSKDEGRIDGWITSAMNGYKKNTVSYNRAAIDLKQTINGLPAGDYKVTVHTYYRAGYYDEEWTRKENGEETHLTTLYAATPDETFEKKVMNLYEDAQPEAVDGSKCYQLANGLYAPDGTDPTVAFFNAGHYLNTLEFDVTEDGSDVTIGLSKTEILPNDYEVVGKWNLYYTPKASEKDVTDLIVNNTFDPSRGSKDEGRIDGWVTSAMNGYKKNTVSYNRAAIDLKQTLNGLPAGHYRMTVHTYYRAGYYDEEWTRKENGEETHLTTLYATTPTKTYETKVMNLYEDAQPEAVDGSKCYTLPNGLFAPDGTDPTVAFFNAGHYLNTLEFDVTEDGSDVTIGLSKTEILPNDYEVVGKWNLYYTPAAAPAEGKDVSDLIVNNTFDPSRGSKDEGRIDGWITSAMNGYKKNTVSYNRAAIDLKQTINGLPAGDYKVTVHTYYRAGYYDEEWTRKENGEETHLTTLYAATPDETFEKKVMNLYEDAQPEAVDGSKCYQLANGLYAPDGTDPTVAFFNAGHYLNELNFTVKENGSDVTIGLKKTEILPNDYEVVGAWHLYYYGNNGGSTDIKTVNTPSAATAVAFYSINGVRLDAPQRGINIVKMSDGRTMKIFVK